MATRPAQVVRPAVVVAQPQKSVLLPWLATVAATVVGGLVVNAILSRKKTR